ncbi:hypothetical protein LEP1GSC076_1030 [Leptospira sp. Fiocruz LV4135]|nr:hypothetical protein LEP1GSC076_1030 [Leptospira sp. Fiocruz LV4135]
MSSHISRVKMTFQFYIHFKPKKKTWGAPTFSGFKKNPSDFYIIEQL